MLDALIIFSVVLDRERSLKTDELPALTPTFRSSAGQTLPPLACSER